MNYFKNQRSSQSKPSFPVDHLHESEINILSQQDKLCHLQPRCSVDSSADDIENKSQQQYPAAAKQDDNDCLHKIHDSAEERSNDTDAIQGQQQQIALQRELQLQQLESCSPKSPQDRFTSAMASVGKSLFGARQLMGLSDEIQLQKDQINTASQATTFTFTLGQQSRPVKMINQETQQQRTAAASLKMRGKAAIGSGYDNNFNLLRCSEQLNPEELLELAESKQMTTTQSQQSYGDAVDVDDLPIGDEDYSDNKEEQIDQRSLEHMRCTHKAQLQLCLNLPSSTANTARAATNNQSLKKVNLMKDASSFGNPFNHGIPYQKRQRQIRLQQKIHQAQEPQPLQASQSSRLSTHLLNFPDHLVVSDDNANDHCVSQQNQDQKTTIIASQQNIISTMTNQTTTQPQSLSQLFKQASKTSTTSSSTAGLQKTRLYLKSQSFSHVMNVRPIFNKGKDSEKNPSSTLVSKISQPASSKSNTVVATTSPSLQFQLTYKDKGDGFVQHQQKVQQYQRRHLLSKRTRVSADQNNIDSYDSLITCLKNQSPSECLQKSNNNDDSSPQLPSLKRFKSECCTMPATGVSTRVQEAALISKDAHKVQLQPHNNRLISQASVSTIATSTSQNQRYQPPQLQRSATMIAAPLGTQSSMLIENESKEVLLRMFEHLIAREQSHQGLESMKGGRRRDSKGFQSKRGGRSGRLRNINDTNMPPGVVNDEGIKSSSASFHDAASTATIVLVNGERELRVTDNDESAVGADQQSRDPPVEGGENKINQEAAVATAYAVGGCVDEIFPRAPPSSQQTPLVLQDEQRVTIGQDGVYRLQFRPSSSSGQANLNQPVAAQNQYQQHAEADVEYSIHQLQQLQQQTQ